MMLLSAASAQQTTPDKDTSLHKSPDRGQARDSSQNPKAKKHKKAKKMLSMHPDSVALRKKQQRPKSNYVPPGVDTTRPYSIHGGIDRVYNTDLWYVVSPQMRKKDSIWAFKEYRIELFEKLGYDKNRQVDSTVWQAWQNKLRKRFRYHKPQAFICDERKSP